MAHSPQILIIICKTSGAQVDVAPVIRKLLKRSAISYRIKIVPDPTKIRSFLKKHLQDTRVVAVYGGDGTVVTAMKALIGYKASLLILPGGTANVVAKDLGLPDSAEDVLKMYIEGRFGLMQYDIAQAGKEPLVLDVHSGWWSEAVKDAPVGLKKKFGVMAYGLTAIKKLPTAPKQKYLVRVRGRVKKVNGYALLVANQGFQNFLNVSLFPRGHRNGMVQVAIIKSLSPLRLAAWFLTKLFTGRTWSRVIRTYQANEVEIIQCPLEVIYDDMTAQLDLPLKVTGGKYQLKVIVPPSSVTRSTVSGMYLNFRLIMHRQLERLRKTISGQPSFKYTRLTPHIYLGGSYRSGAFPIFKSWGVTGLVNMRSRPNRHQNSEVEQLHLKTRDWHAPTLDIFSQGVDFINQHIAAGGSVYIHCRQGEGRGPTMAAAYLISEGLTVEEALQHIKKSRPMAHPNRSQVKQLVLWQKKVAQDLVAKNGN